MQPLFLQAHAELNFVNGDQPGRHLLDDVRQLHNFNVIAHVGHEGLIGLTRFRFDIIPPRGFHKAKLGWQGRLRHRHFIQSAWTLSRTGAVVAVVTGHDFCDFGNVFQIACKDTNFIQRRRLVQNARTG